MKPQDNINFATNYKYHYMMMHVMKIYTDIRNKYGIIKDK